MPPAALRRRAVAPRLRPYHLQALQRRAGGHASHGSGPGVSGLWQPHGLGHPPGRRDRPRPGLGWRHRRALVRSPRGADRLCLRPGHDRRDASARRKEPRGGRRRERPLPQGPHRVDPAPRPVRRGGHLQLRHQPLRGQGPGAAGSLPCARPGGRFAVSDVVVQGQLPERRACRHGGLGGCIAGALEEQSIAVFWPTRDSSTSSSRSLGSTPPRTSRAGQKQGRYAERGHRGPGRRGASSAHSCGPASPHERAPGGDPGRVRSAPS